MKKGDPYMHSGKNGIATIHDVVEAGGRRKSNGKAVIFSYHGGVALRMGKAKFLQCHKELA